MRAEIVILTAVGTIGCTAPSANANQTLDPRLVGHWQCEYMTNTSIGPRLLNKIIRADGTVTRLGAYAKNHSSGISGEYTSKSSISSKDDTIVETIYSYELINPIRNGEPMTEQEREEFESFVETAVPVSYEVLNLTNDKHKLKSKFVTSTCTRLETIS